MGGWDIACRTGRGDLILYFVCRSQCESTMAALPETLAVPAAIPSTARGESRLWVVARTAFPFLVLGGLWEITAHSGHFPPRLFPPLEVIAAALVRLTVSGILPRH